ncbi:hypothetical protein ABL78_5229 [Leptomonas seymouri]|uniref:Uncharacterized protein n=1 Tax=Leptomonas seymouri TaxID=5684 RepID=A0A0N0P582_LEPSE|nr:hypothetical protein ABL78_5229 [Leptomonas seymouri]|eukprot:KPI85697.1 hypothetical protein ABL78_5229 [Leptomonas seymouri]
MLNRSRIPPPKKKLPAISLLLPVPLLLPLRLDGPSHLFLCSPCPTAPSKSLHTSADLRCSAPTCSCPLPHLHAELNYASAADTSQRETRRSSRMTVRRGTAIYISIVSHRVDVGDPLHSASAIPAVKTGATALRRAAAFELARRGRSSQTLFFLLHVCSATVGPVALLFRQRRDPVSTALGGLCCCRCALGEMRRQRRQKGDAHVPFMQHGRRRRWQHCGGPQPGGELIRQLLL